MAKIELPKTYRELFDLIERLPKYACLKTLKKRIAAKYGIGNNLNKIEDNPVSWNLVLDHLSLDHYESNIEIVNNKVPIEIDEDDSFVLPTKYSISTIVPDDDKDILQTIIKIE